ncbi:LacI family DNA-binding transcriptional regulator [Leifsonia sp. Leaf336]|uniref:LacI family DNA-binding transcriptional regulator n=1 Tax=Leifsonia sp. Leaf336 TaxID=1736341 RepID=UPI0009EB4566|nr:LacI family DNA-binding transcriptional regulator [Leifsonia sp. Leaf336]
MPQCDLVHQFEEELGRKVAGKPTVYDVAAHAGVSIATVSRVLTRPDDVRASTQERVLAAVRELRYVPSGSARGLASRRTGVLGLFLPGVDAVEDLSDPAIDADRPVEVRLDPVRPGQRLGADLYFEAVLRGCELEAWRQGFSLMISVGRGRSPESLEIALSDLAGKVDGLAVIAQSAPHDVLKRIGDSIPVVYLAGQRRGDDFDHITVRNREGMRALTEHLIDAHGIRDPMYLTGPFDSPDDAERYGGFAEALEGRGINPTALPVLHGEFSRERARAVAADLIDGGRLPRALVCANDQMALGVLDALGAAGLRVPEDVIVTGFDGIDDGARSTPRLTTVRQPMLELGRAAVRAMVARLNDPDREPVNTELPVTVLLRESCEGPLR